MSPLLLPLTLLAGLTWAQAPPATPPGPAAGPLAELDPKQACTVEGIVVDALTGAGLRNVELTLRAAPGASQSPASTYYAATDKDGKFEITGVAPGAYRLLARRAGYLQTEYGARASGRQGTTLTLLPAQRMTGLEVRLRRGGAISGRVVDEYGDPVERVMVRALRYRWSGTERQMSVQASTSTDDQGHYRLFGLEPGRYYLQVTPGITSTVASGQMGKRARLAYTVVYYPGTTDDSAASPVEIVAGSELSGVDFALARVPAYRVAARVLNVTGSGGRVMAMLRPGRIADSMDRTRFASVDPKSGRVEFQAVIPGSYLLVAAASESGKQLRGAAHVEVTDRDVTELTINLEPGYELTGEVRMEDSQTADPSRLRIRAASPFLVTLSGPEGSSTFGTNAETAVGPDGRFTLSNVFPDAIQIIVSGLPDGFYVKSIQLGDRDILESGLDLGAGPPAGPLRVVLSGRAATVSGTVTGPDDKPLGGATVVLIPQSEKRRAIPRYHKYATTNQNGQFTLKNVDPGDYRAFAWEDVETMAWMDPEILKPVESKGVNLKLEPGSSQTLQLTAIPAQ